MRTRALALLTVGMALALPAMAWGEDPEQAPPVKKTYRKEYTEFLAKPSEVREHLRKMDQALREEDSESQLRLLRLMQRYSDWLDRLTPEQRQRIEDAKTTQERIARIAEIREEQWIGDLPKAERERVAQAKAKSTDEYRKVVDDVKKENQARDAEWLAARNEPRGSVDIFRRQVGEFRKQVLDSIDNERERAVFLSEVNPLPPWKQLAILRHKAEANKVAIPPVLRDIQIPSDVPPMVDRVKLQEFLSRPENEALAREFRTRQSGDWLKVYFEVQRKYWEQHPNELRTLQEHDKNVRKRNKDK